MRAMSERSRRLTSAAFFSDVMCFNLFSPAAHAWEELGLVGGGYSNSGALIWQLPLLSSLGSCLHGLSDELRWVPEVSDSVLQL